ncbi:MAG: 30S ribosomal protein S1 [Candidatus Azosocius agrarius]|nr:MAG: 30S ribosomal protein S1 [Gammaproteobacteria bacterium]
MNENFGELYKKILSKGKVYPGAIITGTVVDIDNDFVIVNANLKSEGKVPVSQFHNENGELEVSIGDSVEIVVDALENGFGETQLSREKAKRLQSWNRLEKAHKDNEVVKGVVVGRVKGGFTVDLQSVKAFLPGSLIDVRPIRDQAELEGQILEFKVIKMDQKRNNVVVSRKAMLEHEISAERVALLDKLIEGQKVKGIVKNLTDYGAFVDLGGLDGLLHITDMAWRRIKHPNEVVNVNEEITVKVLKFDKDKNRVSLGLKQLEEDPWKDISKRYIEGIKLKGVVTNITDYGCFVEIEPGVEGLVHVSEMDWTNKNINPNKIVKLGKTVDVVVLYIDEERRRISLGLKQCIENPWDIFAKNYKKGDKVVGIIKSITDFGIFIGLSGDIDGLIHLSDISWNENGIEILHQYNKGDEIEAIVLGIDAERERISLGIKQLIQDPFLNYITSNPKGTVVKGEILEITLKGITVKLFDEVEGYLKINELNTNKLDDGKVSLKEGDIIESKIINIDKKNRNIILSVKAKDAQEEEDVLKEYNRSSEIVNTTLGDLLKDHIINNELKK